MNGKAPAFQFYAQDFLVDTNFWSCAEVGAHMRLLASSWINGPLDAEPARLARVIGPEFEQVWQTVKEKWVEVDGKIQNPKLEEVRAEALEYRRQRIESGKKGGNPNFKKGQSNPYYKLGHKVEDKVGDNLQLSSGDKVGDKVGDKRKITPSSSSSTSSSSLSLSSVKDGVPDISARDALEQNIDIVIDHLKETTGRKRFNNKTEANRKNIRARLKDGFRVEELIAVVDEKTRQWSTDADRRQYLNPETLFRPSKFEKYLQEADESLAGLGPGQAVKLGKGLGSLLKMRTREGRTSPCMRTHSTKA